MNALFDVSPELQVQRRMTGATVIKVKPLFEGYNQFTGWFTKGKKEKIVIAEADPSCVGDCLKHCKTSKQGRF